MVVTVACLVVLLVVAWFRADTKEPPLDREVVRRIRRFADESRREELLPYE